MKSVAKIAIEQKKRHDDIVRRTRAQQQAKPGGVPVINDSNEPDTLEDIRRVGEDYKNIKGADLTPDQEKELWDIF